MVCTTAFGMGIDQPDVDTLTQNGCPPTLESMTQEFGRVGRDGRLAQGIHLFAISALYVLRLYVGALSYQEKKLYNTAKSS